MSLDYSFRKQDIPFEKWLEKIDEFVVPAERGETPEGCWRELLLSNMMRMEEAQGPYGEKFLTEGSIRGVLVAEQDDEILIKLHSFASRTDHFLAARMVWEAMSLGASVEKDGNGPITTDDLGAETLEKLHQEWFSLSRGTLANLEKGTDSYLPIYDFLSLTIKSGDAEKSGEALERELSKRLTELGDAFLSSQFVVNINGVGEKSSSMLQPEMPSLMMKDVEGVIFDKNIIPMEAFLEALGDKVQNGGGCWIFPPAAKIDPAVLKAASEKSFAAGGAQGDPTEEEWALIGQAPVLAFLLVAAADGNVDKKEVASFGKTLSGLASQHEHPATAKMMQMAQQGLPEILPRLLSGKIEPVELMRSFTELVERRFSQQDAQIIKTAILFTAHQIAESSGGFLGMGPKISKQEKQALGALVSLLGLGDQE
jgi:hypothetical protein